MALFNLFGKKKKEEPKNQKTAPVTEPIKETPAPAVQPTPPTVAEAPQPVEEPKAPLKDANPEKAPAKKKSTNVRKASSNATEKKPATPAKKAPAKSAGQKSAPKTAPKATKVSATTPFYRTTDEDLDQAFNEAINSAEEAIKNSGSKVSGKYEFELEVDGYHFYLIANNGQVLFDSPSFTTLVGALTGLATFQKAVEEGKFAIKADKYGRYRFILDNKYYGENYTTKDQCLKSVDSVKKFASCSKILRYAPTKEALAVFETAKISKHRQEEVDWGAVAKAEAAATKMGKFEICVEDKKYCFYLLANNGQILYSSRYYANEAACVKGIESFKRAAYVGNFFVDCDKFGHYRYVLKNIGSAPSFIGESYDNKAQCEKIIESVKNFIVTASIEKEAE